MDSIAFMDHFFNARGWLPLVLCGFICLLGLRCFFEAWSRHKKGAQSVRRHVFLGSVLLVLAPLVYNPVFALMPALMAIAFSLLGLETRNNRLRPWLDGVALSAGALGGVALLAGYTVTLGFGPSMWPAYAQGFSLTIMDSHAYDHAAPQRGDTVQVWVPNTFNRPGFDAEKEWPAGRYHKRIFAVGGDKISIDPTGLTLNGQRVGDCTHHQASISMGRWLCNVRLPSPHGWVNYQVTWGNYEDGWFWGGTNMVVPKGEVFLLGDNLTESSDSRDHGPVPVKWVVGRHL